MALGRIKLIHLKRRDGKNAIGAAAYAAGQRLVDHRTGDVFAFQRLNGRVEHTEILGPAHMPERFFDRETLWNESEALEKRKDARVGRLFILSIPHELDAEQRCDLVRSFVSSELVPLGMVADIGIHRPDVAKGDHPKNFHAHVLAAQRQMTSQGFRRTKTREWNSQQIFDVWHAAWPRLCNEALARAGSDARIDIRSLEDRRHDAFAAGEAIDVMKLDRLPEPNLPAEAFHRPNAPEHRVAVAGLMQTVRENAERASKRAETLRILHAELVEAERRKRDTRQRPPAWPKTDKAKRSKSPPIDFVGRLVLIFPEDNEISREWLVETLLRESPLMELTVWLLTNAQILEELRCLRVAQLQRRFGHQRPRPKTRAKPQGRTLQRARRRHLSPV